MITAAQDRAQPMPLRKLFELAEDMIYRLPGASDLAVRKELQRAARQFAQDTGAMVGHVWLGDIHKGEYRHPLEAPVSAQIASVKEVTFRGRRVHPHHYKVEQRHQMEIRFHDGWLDSTVEWSGGDSINLKVLVSMVPDLGAEDYPSEFLDRWGDAIVAAAMWRMAGTPGMSWSNPGLAQAEFDRYRSLCADAAMERLGGVEERGLTGQNPVPWLI